LLVPITPILEARGYTITSGRKWRGAPCPDCGGTDRLAVNTDTNRWYCRHCDRGGDVIKLTMLIDKLGFREAVAKLNGMPPPKPTSSSSSAQGGRKKSSGSTHSMLWLEVWKEAFPLSDAKGALGLSYLTRPRAQGGRGLVIPDHLLDGRVLRFHRAHWFDTGDGKPVQMPALLALYRDIRTDRPKAIWRRPLTADGRSAGKPKTLGPKQGYAIKLTDDEDVSYGLAIGEGPETVLAAMMLGFAPAWALGDSGEMDDFPVLAGIGALTIIVDNDKNLVGQEAASACYDRWYAADREVRTVTPVQVGADMADLVGGAP
jgi:hypothetical protein